MRPLPKSWTRHCHSSMLFFFFFLRNFLFIWMQLRTPSSCYFRLILMKTLPITPPFIFPINSFQEHADQAALGPAAGMELIVGLESSHWHREQWEGSKLVPDSKFSSPHPQNGVAFAEAQLRAAVFSPCTLQGVGLVEQLSLWLFCIFWMTFQKSLWSPYSWLVFTSTLKSSSVY